MKKFNLLLLILSLSSFTVTVFPRFFPNITGPWDSFTNLSGSHSGQKVPGISNLKTYLHHFGYNTTNFTDYFDHDLVSAIKQYQKNFNLNRTGELDEPTVKQMIKPRCGVPDIVNGTMAMDGHPYMTVSPEIPEPNWGNFTYAFDPENKLSDDVKRVFVSGFNRWAKWGALTFTESSNYSIADLKIGFYAGDHGDGEAFDGMFGTVAHTFDGRFEPPRGSFHLDSEETWIVDDKFDSRSSTGLDLESVVVHLIGHFLGLGHSCVENAVMFPTFSPGVRKVELDGDDVEGVSVLFYKNPDDHSPTFSQEESSRGHRETRGLVQIVLFVAVGLLVWF